MTTFFHVARPYYPVSSLVLQMIPECESHAKHLEEQMVTFSPLEAQMVKFSHLEEMERKVQQLEQELQWALVTSNLGSMSIADMSSLKQPLLQY